MRVLTPGGSIVDLLVVGPLAAIAGPEVTPPLLVAGVVFTTLAVAGALSWRLRQSVIPAYLVAGVLIGPSGPTLGPGLSLSIVERNAAIDLFAELGIVFLLFFIGVEFSLQKLLSEPGRLLRAGGLDLVVNAGLGFALGLALGFGPVEALFVAALVYPSSSAVVTKTLLDLGWTADPESEAILGVLVLEDLVMAVALALLAAVAAGGGLLAAGRSLVLAGALLLGFILLATVGRNLLAWLLDTPSEELFLLRIVGITTLLAGIALLAGVSEAVAAFFVGAAVSETRHVSRIESVLAPARELFAPVFFFAIGLATDPQAVLAAGVPLLAGVVVSVVGKLTSGYLGGRAHRLNRRRSLRVGTGLVARGEFSLVVAALAATAGSTALRETIPAFAVGYVLAMSVIGTVLMRGSGRIEAVLGLASPSSPNP